jgi:hypothetical protein
MKKILSVGLVLSMQEQQSVNSIKIQKGDSDTVFQVFGANFSKASMKNLVTDKPTPITVALAQKGDADTVF